MTDGPGLFTIPAGVPFVNALAAGILSETKGDPLALADYVILLPTRRACRSLREGFLRVTAGEPLLLPPGVCSRFQGFSVRGGWDIANSTVTVFPRTIAPAPFSLATTAASLFGTLSS